MPLGRKHLRRNSDAPNLGWTIQTTASNLSRTRREVNVPKELDATGNRWKQGISGVGEQIQRVLVEAREARSSFTPIYEGIPFPELLSSRSFLTEVAQSHRRFLMSRIIPSDIPAAR